MGQPLLTLTLLGTFEATLNQTPITVFRSNKIQAMLLYLALQPGVAIPRETLATLFWPNDTESTAKTNLRNSLSRLRKILGDDSAVCLTITRQMVQFNLVDGVAVDAVGFEQAVELADLKTACDLFVGELAPGFSCDAPAFTHWLTLERERFQRLGLEALGELTAALLVQGELAEAERLARRQLGLEPWRELAHYQLMQVLARQGEREAAIAQFESCQDVLEIELGISPSNETFELIQQIESGEYGSGFAKAVPAEELSIPFQAPAVPEHLVGREAEIAALKQQLSNDSASIVALVGMGGIGKSTLAATMAELLRDTFPDGVLWGNPHLSQPANILDLWGRAFGYDFSGLSDLESRATAVHDLLSKKKVLVILDNLDNSDRDYQPLLRAVAGTHAILTTRNRDVAAGVGAEIIPISELSAENSLTLMTRILGQSRLTDEAERAAAEQVGDLLHHHPLSLEITGQLLKARPSMTVQNMVERLQDAQRRTGLKINQKGVRASFETSWDVLSNDLRRTFSLLGVFEGRSFTLEALQAVSAEDRFDTEDWLFDLSALSLVRSDVQDGINRYSQHPLLADFAYEKMGEETAEPFGRMADFYLGYAAEHASSFEQLDPEWNNFSGAVQAAGRFDKWDQVKEFTAVLERPWLNHGRYQDAISAYSLAKRGAEKIGSEKMLADTLLRWAEIKIEQSDYDSAWDDLELALSLYQKLEDGRGIGKSKFFQGCILFDQGELLKAKNVAKASELLLQESNSIDDLYANQELLSCILLETEPTTAESKKMALNLLELLEKKPPTDILIATIRLLSIISFKEGLYEDAKRYAEKALSICESLNYQTEKISAIYALLNIQIDLKNFTEAFMLAEQGLNLVKQLGATRIKVLFLQEISRLYQLQKEFSRASHFADETLVLAEKIQDRLNYGYGLRQKGDILYQLENYSACTEYWKKAEQVANTLQHTELSNQLKERFKFLEAI